MKTGRPNRFTVEIDPEDHRLPVLALHGVASSGGQWQGLSAYLRGRYQVIAPDLPGHGDASMRAANDVRDVAELLLGALASRAEPLHIVGHGHGAAVALEMALSRPTLVRSLTLIEPASFHLLRTGSPADRNLFRELVDLADRMAASIAAMQPSDAMRIYVDFWYGPGAWSRTGGSLRASLASQAEQVTLSLAAALAEYWPRTRCRRASCPTLAVMALESPAASLRVTEIVAEAILGARLVMVPDAGHMAPLTDPHILDPLIASHLKSVDRFEAHLPPRHYAA
jgi:lipase